MEPNHPQEVTASMFIDDSQNMKNAKLDTQQDLSLSLHLNNLPEID